MEIETGYASGRTKDEVVLRNLAVADLLLEGVVAVVDLGVQVGLRESLGDLGRVLFLWYC